MADLLLSLGPYLLLSPIHPHGDARVLATREGDPAGTVFLLDCQSAPNDHDFLQMIADEASLATRVRHPNLWPLVEVLAAPQSLRAGSGRESPPWDFLVAVYEQIPAVSLRRFLRSAGPLPPSIGVSLTLAMLGVLETVHGQRSWDGQPLGMVFRALSLDDAWLALDGRLLLTNLAGLQHRLADPSDPRAVLMRRTFFLFFSPEHLRGDPSGPRDNLWSAAMIAWAAMAGKILFRHESDVVTVQSILDGKRPPLAEIAPGLPPALVAVFERALHRDLASRYATAAEFREDLLAALAPATEGEVASWALDRGAVALAQQESAPPMPVDSYPTAPDEEEAISYRSAPRAREALRMPRRPAGSPISPSLWRRMRWWWARRRSE
jgi:serine/threonine-protein kinase